MSVLRFHPSVANFLQQVARSLHEGGHLERLITAVRDHLGSPAQRVACLAGTPGAELSPSTWSRFTVDQLEAKFTPELNCRELIGMKFLRLHFDEDWMMPPGASLAGRTLFDQVGPWNEALSLDDDGEYFARAMLAALYCAAALTLKRLLTADSSPATRDAVAVGWKWTAFELYPGASGLSRQAETKMRQLGGSSRRRPAGGRFQIAAGLVGWRLAKRNFL